MANLAEPLATKEDPVALGVRGRPKAKKRRRSSPSRKRWRAREINGDDDGDDVAAGFRRDSRGMLFCQLS